MVLIAAIVLAFYLAWNLGANDVANSMGTSVGSKALTLRQALILAGVLEFLGAVLFGSGVSEKLATGVVAIDRFGSPDTVVRLMLAVLLSAGLWLNLATWFGLPVSSSHATVGAIAGVGVLALGIDAVDWRSIGGISLTWVVTPLVSGAISAGLYWSLRSPWFQTQLEEWIPWVAAGLVGVMGWIVLPEIVARTGLPVRAGTVGLGLLGWGLATVAGLSGRGLQGVFGKFQSMSAGAVAFAHGSNDVGNAIAPFAVIVAIEQNRGLDPLTIPLWVLVLGGLGIVGGLAVWGGKVIGTVGEGLLAIEPMVNVGKPGVRVLADGWTAVTRDGSLSAHFEHTVAVTADGCRILTKADSARRAARAGGGQRPAVAHVQARASSPSQGRHAWLRRRRPRKDSAIGRCRGDGR
ncbi:MAG: inorganic phosphate transporter [Alkalinema sp. RU_4_3]|nr:inorganic phosphate transporter [Alkalinema sp. RU_4_3]